MSRENRSSLIGLPIVLLIAAGVAIAGSQGGATIAGTPVFVICVILAFLIQWIAFAYAFARQTEKFYDLTGTLTYLTVVWLAVLVSGATDMRSLLLAGLVTIWTARLGSFLFRRIRAEGRDGRFDDIKPSFARFLLAWTLQGLWVSLTLAAALAAITSLDRPRIGVFAIIGLVVWLIGFGIEAAADRQKKLFRENPANAGKFINTGLWAWSRHPNYFGEIVLWVGVAIIALPVLSGWQFVTLISPVFVFILLTRISGVPMLEQRADEKWGGQADYEAYKASTPVLLLKPPSRKG